MTPHPEVCVGAVVVSGGALLLIRRGRGVGVGGWSIPGGRVEYGETLAAAVCRELLEETGLEGVAGDVIGWVERIGSDHHFVIVDYKVEVADVAAARAGDDATDVAWVPIGSVATHPGLVTGLAEFLAEHRVI